MLILATTLFITKLHQIWFIKTGRTVWSHHLIHVIFTSQSWSAVWHGNKTQVHTTGTTAWVWFILDLICQLFWSLNGLVSSLLKQYPDVLQNNDMKTQYKGEDREKPIFLIIFYTIQNLCIVCAQQTANKLNKNHIRPKKERQHTRLISVGSSSHVWH